MGFLDIGPLEVLLILVIALIIWGPGRISEIARTLGRVARALKKASFDLTAEVTREIDGEEKGHSPQSGKNSGDRAEELSDVGKTEPQRRGD